MKENRISGKSTTPPVIMTGAFILLISFILIAKGLLHDSYREVSVPALSSSYAISSDYRLNNSEQAVLTILSGIIKPSGRKGSKETQESIYYNTLEEFLGSGKVELTADRYAGISDKILGIQEILSDEGKTDYTRLSLDAKKVVLYLLEQIYEICGLHLEGNAEGNIVRISDPSGNILYNNITAERRLDFQLNAFAVVIAFQLVLFIICLTIARKNQLFNKEETYDGFDEEKFA